MIMQNIVLLVAIAAPALLLIVLRTNAAMVFLSLCAGALLVRFAGGDASLVGSAVGNNSAAMSQYFQLALLLLPVVLSALFLRKSMTGPKTVLNILPAISVGLVGVLLAVPLLPGGVQHTIMGLNGWSLLEKSKEVVVLAGTFVSLVVLWMTGRPHHKDKKKHH